MKQLNWFRNITNNLLQHSLKRTIKQTQNNPLSSMIYLPLAKVQEKCVIWYFFSIVSVISLLQTTFLTDFHFVQNCVHASCKAMTKYQIQKYTHIKYRIQKYHSFLIYIPFHRHQYHQKLENIIVLSSS